MRDRLESPHSPAGFGMPEAGRGAVREALRQLDVRHFVLGIHESALPSAPGPETGCGSLAAAGGRAFLASIHRLGFDAVQLGPGGMTDSGNPSPYDGTLFSRSLLTADLTALAEGEQWEGLLTAEELDHWLASPPDEAAARVPHAWTWRLHVKALTTAGMRLARRAARGAHGLAGALRAFDDEHGTWVRSDGLYQVLAERYGSEDWRRWPAPEARDLWNPEPGREEENRAYLRSLEGLYAEAIDAWCAAQFILHRQREQARQQLADLGLSLFGDLQVGMSLRDEWRYRVLFLPGYRLGAPPSRTNPEGQPWGYPVFHPEKVFAGGAPPPRWPLEAGEAEPGPVLRFLDARFERAFAAYDALRVDHPHGLVCPWVYRGDARDAYGAVRAGARLLSSPDLPDHPELSGWSIPRPEQIDTSRARWEDARVRGLEPDQVSRYGLLLDRARWAAERVGGGAERLVCEVLSTMPLPLGEVMARYGMGRFRVTHKASLEDPGDVYRPENARPEDWVMLATQDTPPIWQVIDRWSETGERERRAAHLAARLSRSEASRERMTRQLAEDDRALATGMLAELLACRARHVMVFFTDLLGIDEPYNRPGVDSPLNWTRRAPALGVAGAPPPPLDIPRACTWALQARGLGSSELLAALGAGSV